MASRALDRIETPNPLLLESKNVSARMDTMLRCFKQGSLVVELHPRVAKCRAELMTPGLKFNDKLRGLCRGCRFVCADRLGRERVAKRDDLRLEPLPLGLQVHPKVFTSDGAK